MRIGGLPLQVAILSGLLAILAPSYAFAFNRSSASANGPALYWCMREIPYSVNEKGSLDAGASSFEAIQASFDAWTAPSCTDLKLINTGKTPSTAIGLDGINLVVFREKRCELIVPKGDSCIQNGSYAECNNKFNCWGGEIGAIALTTTSFNRNTGEIFDSDIEFNAGDFVFSTVERPECPDDGTRSTSCLATDIGNALTHEVGHFVGIDHSDEFDATMYYRADNHELKKRTIAQDDIDAVCFIYPVGRNNASCGDPTLSENPKRREQAIVHPLNGCSQAPQESGEPSYFSLLALGLGALKYSSHRSPKGVSKT